MQSAFLKLAVSVFTLIYILLINLPGSLAQTPEARDLDEIEACYEANPAMERADVTDPNAPAIQMVEPKDETVFYGKELVVNVTTRNFDISTQGWHWHLWVDEQLQVMLHEQVSFVELTPGTHRLCAFLSDANHVDFGVPDVVTVTAIEPGPGTPRSTLAIPLVDQYVNRPTEIRKPENNNGILMVIFIVGGAVLITLIGALIGLRLSPIDDEDDEDEAEEALSSSET